MIVEWVLRPCQLVFVTWPSSSEILVSIICVIAEHGWYAEVLDASGEGLVEEAK